ncbi:hypothetical protein ZIOFF_032345 [Zingiber officinale]|uniref:Protein kinase domain-containing protein n=1 Tax=Zingiber officinale TaxID=94328 RepID=A0A8J5GMM4_ZINOF|nr:hypothetical protein ZIOFF_032345 [Zingiber officinale]
MAAPRVEEVIDFLFARGFSAAADALRDDVLSRCPTSQAAELDLDVGIALPPLKLSTPSLGGGDTARASADSSPSDTFVSLGSSPFELLNPYGVWSPARSRSDEESTDRQSDFGTARAYNNYWYDDQIGEYCDMFFIQTDSGQLHSEDKFIMSAEEKDQFEKKEMFDFGEDGHRHKHDHVGCKGSVDMYDCPFPIRDCCSGSKIDENEKVAEMIRSSSFAVYGRYQILDDQTERLDECGENEVCFKRIREQPDTIILEHDRFHDRSRVEGKECSESDITEEKLQALDHNVVNDSTCGSLGTAAGGKGAQVPVAGEMGAQGSARHDSWANVFMKTLKWLRNRLVFVLLVASLGDIRIGSLSFDTKEDWDKVLFASPYFAFGIPLFLKIMLRLAYARLLVDVSIFGEKIKTDAGRILVRTLAETLLKMRYVTITPNPQEEDVNRDIDEGKQLIHSLQLSCPCSLLALTVVEKTVPMAVEPPPTLKLEVAAPRDTVPHPQLAMETPLLSESSSVGSGPMMAVTGFSGRSYGIRSIYALTVALFNYRSDDAFHFLSSLKFACGAEYDPKIKNDSKGDSYNRNIFSVNKMDDGELQKECYSISPFEEEVYKQGAKSAHGDGDCRISNKELQEPEAVDLELKVDIGDELRLYNSHENELEIFDLRIIHRKNRTGFEESKEFPIVLKSVIAGRYYITEYLGSAAFSKVVQAHDLHTGMDVCLKIINNDKDFFDQSLDEIKLLKFVNRHDPSDEHHLLRLYDYFYYQEHLFIVTELLKANLYEFQKYNHESGGVEYYTLSRIQDIARQCLEALLYLHHLRIIHCDLKPENILLKSYSRCEIKIIDLGSSCFEMDNLCTYVQSRSYRAPEVILGLSYDQKIDIWSLGCILAELYTGDVLFPNDSVPMILARMIGILGPIDEEMLSLGLETNKYFTEKYDLYHTNEETDQVEYLIPESSSLSHQLLDSDAKFVDFLSCLLQINPRRRPTASEALEHEWLSISYH